MKLGKITSVVLVAVALLAVGALAGQLRQPAPAGAADNSGAMLQQLKLMNAKLADQTTQLNRIRADIGDYDSIGHSLRRDMYNVCQAIIRLPDDDYIDC